NCLADPLGRAGCHGPGTFQAGLTGVSQLRERADMEALMILAGAGALVAGWVWLVVATMRRSVSKMLLALFFAPLTLLLRGMGYPLGPRLLMLVGILAMVAGGALLQQRHPDRVQELLAGHRLGGPGTVSAAAAPSVSARPGSGSSDLPSSGRPVPRACGRSWWCSGIPAPCPTRVCAGSPTTTVSVWISGEGSRARLPAVSICTCRPSTAPG